MYAYYQSNSYELSGQIHEFIDNKSDMNEMQLTTH